MAFKIKGLAKFKNVKRDYKIEDIEREMRALDRRKMEPNVIHECKVVKVIEEKTMLNQVDPEFLDLVIEVENAEGATQMMFLTLPLTTRYQFRKEDGKLDSKRVAASFKRLKALGFSSEDAKMLGERIVATEGNAVFNLIGMHLKVHPHWGTKAGYFHPQYDSASSAWFIHDNKGNRVLNEPFQLKEGDDVPYREKFAEMAYKTETELNGIFVINPYVDFIKHDIENDFSFMRVTKPNIVDVEDEEELEDEDIEEEEEEELEDEEETEEVEPEPEPKARKKKPKASVEKKFSKTVKSSLPPIPKNQKANPPETDRDDSDEDEELEDEDYSEFQE